MNKIFKNLGLLTIFAFSQYALAAASESKKKNRSLASKAFVSTLVLGTSAVTVRYLFRQHLIQQPKLPYVSEENNNSDMLSPSNSSTEQNHQAELQEILKESFQAGSPNLNKLGDAVIIVNKAPMELQEKLRETIVIAS